MQKIVVWSLTLFLWWYILNTARRTIRVTERQVFDRTGKETIKTFYVVYVKTTPTDSFWDPD